MEESELLVTIPVTLAITQVKLVHVTSGWTSLVIGTLLRRVTKRRHGLPRRHGGGHDGDDNSDDVYVDATGTQRRFGTKGDDRLSGMICRVLK